MKAPAFAYVKPALLAEAFDLLAHHGDEAKILAGGQSLIAALNMRLAAPRVLVDIGGLSELAGIRITNRTITVGALTRQRTIERSSEIAQHLPLLHQALPHIAHAAVRNRGTFGGSIAFADPAAELPACCLALGATFVIANRDRTRRVAARDFFRGLYETALAPGEILLGAEFPVLEPGYRSAFQELARRHGDYAIVGLVAHAKVERDTLSDLRLAFFGAGATPVLAHNASARLEGRPFSPEVLRAAQDALEDDLDPYDDMHQSAAARMHLARVLTGRVVAELVREEQ